MYFYLCLCPIGFKTCPATLKVENKGLTHFMNAWIIVAIPEINQVMHIIRMENIGIM